MDNIIDNIKKIKYKSNISLQKDLQNLNPTELRTIAQNLKLIQNTDKFKSKKLIKLILAFYKENKCSLQKPCENLDDSCNIETGKCENLVKTTITDSYGQNINVIGNPENIKSIQESISSSITPITTALPPSNPILDYRLNSFYTEGMTDVLENGDCFFICIQKLLELTHDTQYTIQTIREKISKCIKILTITKPPILDPISLINEMSNISSIEEYISLISTASWGGEPEIIAASSLYNKIIIVKTLKLNIPDRIYFPSIQLPNRNVQPGLWTIYHTNSTKSENLGNHYQYKGNITQGQFSGSIKDVYVLEKILDLEDSLQQDISPSMSILSSEGIQYAGNPESLQVLNKKGIIKTKQTEEQDSSQIISIPKDELGIQKPDEQEIISHLQSQNLEKNTQLQSDIKNFLYPSEN